MLYQTVRPTTLDGFVGNEAARTKVQRALDTPESRSHVYLFHGPSGCGKTTLARIMGLALTTETSNVIEMNAANERGIETARNLDSYARHTPIGGGNRVVILDEAHMLTREAQNCLLKTFEDVPDHCYYILCSTEPAKIIKTIQTRAEMIEVQPLRRDDILDLLDDAIGSDAADVGDPGDKVVGTIAKAADGCPRQALVLLEQTVGLDEEAALAAIEGHLQGDKELIDLCRKFLKRAIPWRAIVKVYSDLGDREPERVRRGLLGYLTACLKKAASDADAERYANQILDLSEHTYDSGEPKLLAMMFMAFSR